MWLFLGTTPLTCKLPRAGSASLVKRGKGWEDCWIHAHLGTCWETCAHAIKCSVALRAPFDIVNYPEIQAHGPLACRDQHLMAAGIRNLLCSPCPQVPSSLIRNGPPNHSEECVFMCACVWARMCVPGFMCVPLGSRQWSACTYMLGRWGVHAHLRGILFTTDDDLGTVF